MVKTSLRSGGHNSVEFREESEGKDVSGSSKTELDWTFQFPISKVEC